MKKMYLVYWMEENDSHCSEWSTMDSAEREYAEKAQQGYKGVELCEFFPGSVHYWEGKEIVLKAMR